MSYIIIMYVQYLNTNLLDNNAKNFSFDPPHLAGSLSSDCGGAL